ncbi:MAG TPA: phage holin family protein [Methylomirabilota bacterium]|nr:phage holin family protein [Methylomirabilota bacterium]
MGLVKAHIDLAKAEAAAIGGEIAKAAALGCLAIGFVVLALVFAFIGASMFLAEWLLGSLGWGVLHGVLLLVAIAVACALVPLGMSGFRIGRAFVIGVALAVLVSLLLTLALPNRAYTSIGESLLPGIEPGVRPLVVGASIFAVIGLLAGLILALRFEGWGARIGALLGGLVVGALIGAVTAVDTGPQVGVGIGVAVGYITWIGIMAADMARTGVDMEALKARFMPTQTIETSKETLAWLQSKMPPGTGS